MKANIVALFFCFCPFHLHTHTHTHIPFALCGNKVSKFTFFDFVSSVCLGTHSLPLFVIFLFVLNDTLGSRPPLTSIK